MTGRPLASTSVRTKSPLPGVGWRATAWCAWSSTPPAATTRPTRSSAGPAGRRPQLEIILVGDEARRAAADTRRHRARLRRARARRRSVTTTSRRSAARNKTESSIVVGLKLVHEGGADAFVSAGNTGAVVAGSLLYVRRINGVQRPAICTIMPCMPTPIAFLDVGANAECRPEHLRQFAVMGQAFAARSWGSRAHGRAAVHRRGAHQGHAGRHRGAPAHRRRRAHPLLRQRRGPRHHEPLGRRRRDRRLHRQRRAQDHRGRRKAASSGRCAAPSTSPPGPSSGACCCAATCCGSRRPSTPEEYGGAFLVGMNAPVIIAHGNSKAARHRQRGPQGRRGVVSDLPAEHRRVSLGRSRHSVDSAKLIRRFVDDP